MLPDAAVAIIRKQPRMGGLSYMFLPDAARVRSADSAKPRRRSTPAFADMPAWVLHDLRRTARSLMARASVRPDIAERVLGHAIPGVRGIYDRHSYRAKRPTRCSGWPG